MNCIQKPDMIFIDFDGVISKSSLIDNIKNYHWFINQYVPIPFEFTVDFFKITMCFPVQSTISYLFSSLGIEDRLPELYKEEVINKFYDNEKIKIEEDFFQFIDFCTKNGLPYLIYSSRDNSYKSLADVITGFDPSRIYDLKGRSKGNYNTFLEVGDELNLNLSRCIYVDDNPLALQTGKRHGMTTIMMINDIFTLKDYDIFHSFINYKINSFADLLSFFINKW